MKSVLTFTFLLVVFLCSTVCAQEISFNFPEKVNLNQEFTVELELLNFSADIYDVKIDILENSNRIAQILNGGQWKSTYYYLNDVINAGELKQFNLKIIQEFSVGEITIKIKDSSGNTQTFTGYEISKDFEATPDPPPEINTTPQTNTTNYQSQPLEEKSEEIETKLDFSTEVKPKEEKEIQTIKLNEGSSEEISEPKTLNNKNYSAYYLISFCFLLTLLYLLNQRKSKKQPKNEFK